MKTTTSDIVIIGGGLAGLTSAIHLSRAGLQVTVIERNTYPKHKVCGEYISNEVLPYLQYLHADPITLGAKRIERFLLSTTRGKISEAQLPLGGFSISRYTLDHFLARKAIENGCTIIEDSVADIHYEDDRFRIVLKEGQEWETGIAIGAFGKRSNMDVKLKRPFIRNRSPFVAVKTHMKGDFPEDLVALHNFEGGYCGVSQVENGNLNVCYIANYEHFKRYRNTEAFEQEVLYKNPHLRSIFENSTPVFEQPLSISQISFSNKSTVEGHVLMCGDAAGMIHPLCGNGMAMAIRSAKILSELIIGHLQKGALSRKQLEEEYDQQWNKEFKKRITAGRILQNFFGKDNLSRVMMYGVTHIPGVLPAIIKQTHGKPINITRA